MKKLVLSAALLASGLLASSRPSFAHGGMYRGPGDTVPPAGSGGGVGGPAGPTGGPGAPTTPFGGPTVPGAGPAGTPGIPGTTAQSPGGDGGLDLTQWTFWWEFNKEPYLQLKARIHAEDTVTGSDGFFLGNGARSQGRDRFKPSHEQIRGEVVPALLAALEGQTNNDIVSACLIALAKIGAAPGTAEDEAFEEVLARFLPDRNQEISETAAVALGILANRRSIPTLAHLLGDDEDGRVLVGRPEVGYRTRAFAAYGLGLVGSVSEHEEDRQRIVQVLRETIESEATRTRDLKASCVIALGLVPLATAEADAPRAPNGLMPPESSRRAQLEYLEAFLLDERQNSLVRAHCPTALARLLDGQPEATRARITGVLLERLDPRRKEPSEVLQSVVLALGRIGTNDDASPLDRRIREALVGVQKEVSDAQARNFALIALAKLGGTTVPGAQDSAGGVEAVAQALLAQLAAGKSSVRPWAGLACGVLAERVTRSGNQAPFLASLGEAVRGALEAEKDPAKLGAYALACGIMHNVEAKEALLERLLSERDESARGYVAVGLGLMNAREAIDALNRIADDARYRPDLLKNVAIALGLLGDKELVPKLLRMLQEAKGLATQASLSSALGFIGDHRSIAPLVAMLANEDLTERARAFAAVALGIVGDKELLPWNSRIGQDLNYRAATETLTNPASGTGILDIL